MRVQGGAAAIGDHHNTAMLSGKACIGIIHINDGRIAHSRAKICCIGKGL